MKKAVPILNQSERGSPIPQVLSCTYPHLQCSLSQGLYCVIRDCYVMFWTVISNVIYHYRNNWFFSFRKIFLLSKIVLYSIFFFLRIRALKCLMLQEPVNL